MVRLQILWALEKVFSPVIRCRTCYVPVRFTLLIVVFRSSTSSLNVCPSDLPCPENGVLKSPIVNVFLSMYPSISCSFYFIGFLLHKVHNVIWCPYS